MSELHKRIANVLKKYPDAYPTSRGLCVKQKFHDEEELLLFWKGLDKDPMFSKEEILPEVEEGALVPEEVQPEEIVEEEKPKRGRKPKEPVEVQLEEIVEK